MNAIDQARKAYAPAVSPLLTSRSTEYQAFSSATQKLRAAGSRAAKDFPRLAAAIHENRALWTTLAADVADPGNGLPATLRAQIFYLAEFTEHHSRRILRGEADVEPLVEINSAVMRGLAGTLTATSAARVAS